MNPKYQTQNGFNYSFVLFFEEKYFDAETLKLRVAEVRGNWYKCFYYAFIYVVSIHLLQYFMRSRERFNLRKYLVIWNMILASYSILGSVRVLPEFLYVIQKYGLRHIFCINDFTYGIVACYGELFVYSKVAELFDTLFVVLRKQNLSFLHWYHHTTVLIFTWYSSKNGDSSGYWFCVMNYFVHAFMYTYYSFKSMGFKIPKPISITITIMQISQMVIGIYVNFFVYFSKARGELCEVGYENIYAAFLLYASYFILFCHFFYNAYLKRSSKKDKLN